MGAWSMYENRIAAHGGSRRNATLIREVGFINSKLPDNPSYQTVEFCPQEYGFNIESDEARTHRYSQNVAIIDSDDLNEKFIYSMPAEDIRLGSLALWMGSYWLVYERSANTTIYTTARLLQCNHLLKWISSEKEIIEQWCAVEDGTKYLIGESTDRNLVITRGDSRIAIQIAKNHQTACLNRESRFLVDDEDSPHKLAYQLTKPLKRGLTYNGEGTYKFILQEVTATDYDNHELGIADYYKYFPSSSPLAETKPTLDAGEKKERRVWL